ncbi:MAG TPA: aldehyde dehydrogenase family protein [Sporichthyaceae bacterium]|nr:aldehyde dehydrogenase family protein [Sporichthyaceae bacterium]
MGELSSPAPALPPAAAGFVAGWLPGGAGVEQVLDPATGTVLGDVPRASAAHVAAAVAAARHAAEGPWGRETPAGRSALLARLHAELAGDVDRILDVVVAETGCPVTLARGQQAGLALAHLAYWAEAALRPELDPRPPVVTTRPDGTGVVGNWVVRREPYGVVAAITPYNFPFLENVMKLGPALAAGNAVVLKPSPYTPFSALLIAEAWQRADLPPGVLNVVTGGAAVGVALAGDPGVDLISFTGSDVVGAAILAVAAPRLTKVLLELGGKSALIVRADADLDLAARVGAASVTTHAGQGCVLTTRHIVHEAVNAEYVERVATLLGKAVVGDPRHPATTVGPLIRHSARERVEGYVAGALDRGAAVVHGAARPGGLPARLDGAYYLPTVLGDVHNSWPVAREEIFGPVAVVLTVADDDEAIAVANDSPYGLAGHIIGRDTAAAFALAARLRAGSIDLNGGPGYTNPAVPFGGMKRSGLGRENGPEGLDEYTQLKTIKYPAR